MDWQTQRQTSAAADIMLLEARAAVKAMRIVAVSRHGWHTRQLFLGNNMRLVLRRARAQCIRC